MSKTSIKSTQARQVWDSRGRPTVEVEITLRYGAQGRAIAPGSYIGYLVSTFQGSTETTFYVLAVYYGAVGIRRIRHTLVAALSADIVGIGAAVFIVSWLYGT